MSIRIRLKILRALKREIELFKREQGSYLGLKLDSVTPPSHDNIRRGFRNDLSPEQMDSLLEENKTHRVKATGTITFEGPRFEWYNKCIAWKRVAWNDESDATIQMVKDLAMFDANKIAPDLYDMHTPNTMSILQRRLIQHHDGVDIEYTFNLVQTTAFPDLDITHNVGFEEMVMCMFSKMKNRVRTLWRQHFWVNAEFEQRERELSRGRPSNRNLYAYVNDYLPRHWKASNYIIGKANPEYDDVHESTRHGNETNYPEYETEGRPRQTMGELIEEASPSLIQILQLGS